MQIPPDRQQNKIAYKFIKRKAAIKGTKILDVGAADCILKPFFPKTTQYYSLDIKNYEGCKHDFLLDLDKEKIPVNNGFFDIILCLDTLEHTMYPKKILKEFERITKKDSLFVFALPNEYNFVQRIYYLFGIKKQTEIPWEVVAKHEHIQKPRIKDIINLFKPDFKIHKIKYHWESRTSSNNKHFIIVDKMINLLVKISPNLFARDVVLLCSKK